MTDFYFLVISTKERSANRRDFSSYTRRNDSVDAAFCPCQRNEMKPRLTVRAEKESHF